MDATLVIQEDRTSGGAVFFLVVRC